MVDKTFRKLFYRKLATAMGRWKDKVINRKLQGETAQFTLQKMRRRFLRQAFDQYLHFLHKSQQHSRNEVGADYMVETLNIRQMRKVYFAMCYHTKWKLRVKQVWTKVLCRLDRFQRLRAMKRWCDNAHDKFKFDLENTQNYLVNHIDNQNSEIGRYNTEHLGQEHVIAG